MAIGLLDRILSGTLILLLSGALAVGIGVFIGAFDSATDTKSRLARTFGILSVVTGLTWWVGAASGSQSLVRPLSPAATSLVEAGLEIKASGVHAVEDRKGLVAVIAASEKPVMVDVYADWCTSCRDMDEFLHDPELEETMDKYTLVKLDITRGTKDQQALLSEWQVFGPPALQRFSPSGERTGAALQGLPSMKSFLRWERSE